MYVKRDLEITISKYISKKEIIAIVGARQCGKTTIINNVLKNYKKVNSISFDDVKMLHLFENDIDSFIKLNVDGYDYLFIDEIQYSKDSGKKLKYIYDSKKIKIIISGSSSPEISIQCLKYLVGRIFVFSLHNFSFREYLKSKDDKYVKLYDTASYKQDILDLFNSFINEFITYGSYPRVVVSQTQDEKILVLKNIYDTYLLKEIKEIMELSDNNKLISLLKLLSLQIGNVINYAELSSMSGFSFLEIKKYLKILEDTFISQRISTFSKNKRTEIVKSPKIYFHDLGFRNISIDNFNKERTDKGAMIENLIFSELIKKNYEVKYWRTKSGAEMDFIIDDNIAVEVKLNLSKPNITKSFASFLNKYKPKKAYVISKNLEDTRKINNTLVLFVPLVKFISKTHL